MTHRTMTLGFIIGAAILCPLTASADHGKAGLWNVTSTTQSSMALDPEVMAQMKKMGAKLPGAQAMTSQSCMTTDEVKSNMPAMQGHSDSCGSHVTAQTASSVSIELVCKGEAKGTGHVQITWAGAEHYKGTYDFKGAIDDTPTQTNSQFKADWVKADCGAVKPQH